MNQFQSLALDEGEHCALHDSMVRVAGSGTAAGPEEAALTHIGYALAFPVEGRIRTMVRAGREEGLGALAGESVRRRHGGGGGEMMGSDLLRGKTSRTAVTADVVMFEPRCY